MHVTVLMAVYNARGSVSAAIESIRAQTFTDWDCLIVDDGSTDGTWEILQQAASADRRISLLRNRSNRGLAASLNAGWRQARGEVIARLDADDISFPERLAKQVAFLERHPEVDVLGTAMEMVDATGRFLEYGRRPERHDEIVAQMYRINPFVHPSVMMRKRFLEALGGYDERLRRAQDADLWLRGYRRFRYHNLPDPLVRYRMADRLSPRSIAYCAFVQLRSAFRERRLFSRGWYALRTLAAGFLIYLHLYHRVAAPLCSRRQ